MAKTERRVFSKQELAGSRLRCLMMTSGSRRQVADCLEELIQPFGIIESKKDHWMPKGFLGKAEAQLGRTKSFLSVKQREVLLKWWLKKRRGSQTPNWDIASICKINGQRGLLLVEAKAHGKELKGNDYCSSTNKDNRKQIAGAISSASAALNGILPGWALSRDTHYQLCNRWAWSWKLATLGVPVILVYLGFLNADEMSGPFRTAEEWQKFVLHYSEGIVPPTAWTSELNVNGTPVYGLIRAMDYKWEVTKAAGKAQ